MPPSLLAATDEVIESVRDEWMAERLGRAFERCDLTEDDPVFGDTVFGERRNTSKTKSKNCHMH